MESPGIHAEHLLHHRVKECQRRIGDVSLVILTLEIKDELTRDIEIQDIDLHDVAVLSEILIARVVRIRVASVALWRILVARLGVILRRLIGIGHHDDRSSIRIPCACVSRQSAILTYVCFEVADLQGQAHPLGIVRADADLVARARLVLLEVDVRADGPARQRGRIRTVVIHLCVKVARVGLEDGDELRGELHLQHIQEHHQEGEIEPDARTRVAERHHELRGVIIVLAFIFLPTLIDRADIVEEHVRERLLVVEIGAEEEPQRILQGAVTVLTCRRAALARRFGEITPDLHVEGVGEDIGEVETRDLETRESKDREGHIRRILRIHIVHADREGGFARTLIYLRDLEHELGLLAVLEIDKHLHMDTEIQLGLLGAVIHRQGRDVLLLKSEQRAQEIVEPDGERLFAARERKVDRGGEADLHLVCERIILVTRDLGSEVVRAAEESVLHRVLLDDGLRLEARQGDGDVVLPFLLTRDLDEGILHTVRRRRVELGAEICEILIA